MPTRDEQGPSAFALNIWRKIGSFVAQSSARALIGAVAVAGVVGIYSYAKGLGKIEFVLLLVAIVAIALLSIGLYGFLRLLPLMKWRGLTETTDLSSFTEENKNSRYMPEEILKRNGIRDLAVMGNGCSKWTMYVARQLAITQFSNIRRANSGAIRFLACCPKALSEREGTPSDLAWMKQKAAHNAKSLLQLRDFKRSTEAQGGRFEIRTYKHLATLRLIIINEQQCIVGHYKEDGTGQSFDTPLMVFECVNKKGWGFGHAFRRLFEHEWYRSKEPTEEEWKTMEVLASQLVSPALGYPG